MNVDFPVKLQDKVCTAYREFQPAAVCALAVILVLYPIVAGMTAAVGSVLYLVHAAKPVPMLRCMLARVQAKASNETQQRANDSKSDGMQRPGADALGDVISKVRKGGYTASFH